MRKFALAAILLASCAAATAQETASRGDKETPPAGNWFTRLWSSDPPPSKKSEDAPKKSEPSAAEIRAKLHAKQEADLTRRKEVILKLREIAVHTHDEALLRKTDELDERAWQLFLQQQPAAVDETAPNRRGLDNAAKAQEGKR